MKLITKETVVGMPMSTFVWIMGIIFSVFVAYFELKAGIDEAKEMPPQEISADEIKLSLDGIQKQLDLMNNKIDKLDERLYELNSGE
jgi:hypothetical protein